MDSVDFPVVFTFSDEVKLGTGCVVFENDFGDLTKVCDEESGISLAGVNATIQQKDKFYYGSSYKIYFEESPFVDADSNPVVLAKGDYVFFINSIQSSFSFQA